MLIHDRIKLIMKSQNASASEFADAIDVKRSNLSHVLSGRNKPSLDFLAKIINHYPNVNAAWLVTGTTAEGTFKGPEETPSEKHPAPKIDPANENGVQKSLVKVIAFYSDGTYETLAPSEK